MNYKQTQNLGDLLKERFYRPTDNDKQYLLDEIALLKKMLQYRQEMSKHHEAIAQHFRDNAAHWCERYVACHKRAMELEKRLAALATENRWG